MHDGWLGGSGTREFAELIRARRSVRDFLPDPVSPDLLDAVLADASWAPS
jgi:nitroreductase